MRCSRCSGSWSGRVALRQSCNQHSRRVYHVDPAIMAVLLPGHAGRLQAGAQKCCELFCNGTVGRSGGVIVWATGAVGSRLSASRSDPWRRRQSHQLVHRHEQEVGGIVAILIIDDLLEDLYAVALARDQAQQPDLRRLNESGLGGEIRLFPSQLSFHERVVRRDMLIAQPFRDTEQTPAAASVARGQIHSSELDGRWVSAPVRIRWCLNAHRPTCRRWVATQQGDRSICKPIVVKWT